MAMTREELSAFLNEQDSNGFHGTCGITFKEFDGEHAIATMPITPALFQPFGFVHGGATLTLLEAVASRAMDLRANLETEQPFGLNVNVWHKRPGVKGTLTGIAELDHEELSANGSGRKQWWNVRSIDDDGNVCSEGVVITKIVNKDYLAKKNAARNL